MSHVLSLKTWAAMAYSSIRGSCSYLCKGGGALVKETVHILQIKKHLDLTFSFCVVRDRSANHTWVAQASMRTLVKWNCIGSSVDREIIRPFWRKSKKGFFAYSRNRLLLLNGDMAMGIWAKKNKYCSTGL